MRQGFNDFFINRHRRDARLAGSVAGAVGRKGDRSIILFRLQTITTDLTANQRLDGSLSGQRSDKYPQSDPTTRRESWFRSRVNKYRIPPTNEHKFEVNKIGMKCIIFRSVSESNERIVSPSRPFLLRPPIPFLRIIHGASRIVSDESTRDSHFLGSEEEEEEEAEIKFWK